jgi:hypothetical protein
VTAERFDLRRLRLYETMILIRLFEPEAERQYKKANIGGYCHLSTGQEGATVGAVAPLREEDYLVMSYRTHGLALARGTSPEAVMAELFGREGGCARGRGGSMHLLDVDRNMLGGWGIVCGQLPIATGVALALVQQGRGQAVLCELGDGAVNMGAWHESLNLAGVWNLPIVYLVMNNQYGMGTTVDRASAEPELYKRAGAYRIHGERVDGDDLVAREGSDLTIVSHSFATVRALHVAERLAAEHEVQADVVDLRSLRPLDMETVAASVAKTNRVLCIEEGWPTYGVTAEIAARVQQGASTTSTHDHARRHGRDSHALRQEPRKRHLAQRGQDPQRRSRRTRLSARDRPRRAEALRPRRRSSAGERPGESGTDHHGAGEEEQ